ncbi:MAG: protoheme IX farnesyltransferase [Acidimicrobiia bacterium]|nr:protoheme IX farnesyltransferase [Acidimicrobiia bacterium]
MTSSVVEKTTTPSGLWDRVRTYVALTKPRIIELLLITTVPAMVLAAQGWPGTWLVLATLIGGTLSAAGANTLNSYFDRDIDELMGRTKKRPLPVHGVEARNALWFGIALGVAGFAWLWVFTNLTAALWSTAALLFYVVVYTILLKRTTTQNIVIGGAAGAAPALVGWAAVTGGVGLPAWILFAIVFYWTPPHFWALALRYKADYATASVPMLPVVRGRTATVRQILLYSTIMVWLTLLLVPVAGMGWVYMIGAIGLGAWFFWESWRMTKSDTEPIRLFTASNIYLAALSAVIVADVLIR